MFIFLVYAFSGSRLGECLCVESLFESHFEGKPLHGFHAAHELRDVVLCALGVDYAWVSNLREPVMGELGGPFLEVASFGGGYEVVRFGGGRRTRWGRGRMVERLR